MSLVVTWLELEIPGKAHFLVLLKRHYQKTLEVISELRETRFESEQHQLAGLDELKGRRKAEGGSPTALSQQAETFAVPVTWDMGLQLLRPLSKYPMTP